MKISILTLFPEMFAGPFDHSIVKRAREKKLAEIEFINIRNFGIGKHQIVDDTPYGGGIGMVMRIDVLHNAIQHAKDSVISSEATAKSRNLIPSETQTGRDDKKERIVLLSAAGSTYNQAKAKQFSNLDHLILICGHYEGVDERIKTFIDEEISIGDFVLTGGEIPAMLITDSVTRLLSGVLPEGATEDESFSEMNPTDPLLLEYPHYTKPQVYENLEVPKELLSGNHKKIGEWRKQQSEERTKIVRPDLLSSRKLKT